MTFTITENIPATTGDAIGRFLGGSTNSRISAPEEGLIVQLYPDAWADGLPHAGVNVFVDVPANARFHGWGVSAVVRSASTDGANEHAAYWGRAEGSGGSPLWGMALEVTDKRGGVSAATTLVGVEIANLQEHSGSTGVGIDIIGKGSQMGERGLHVRDSGNGSGWRLAAKLETMSNDVFGPVLRFFKKRSSEASDANAQSGDVMGDISWSVRNAAGIERPILLLRGVADNVTNNLEDANLLIYGTTNGVFGEWVRFDSEAVRLSKPLRLDGQTVTSATSGSATLPANPAGFFTVCLEGTTAYKVPYYI